MEDVKVMPFKLCVKDDNTWIDLSYSSVIPEDVDIFEFETIEEFAEKVKSISE